VVLSIGWFVALVFSVEKGKVFEKFDQLAHFFLTLIAGPFPEETEMVP